MCTFIAGLLYNKCKVILGRVIVYMTIARLLGTMLAQLLFLPGAQLLAWTATHI